jgi:hypothetical protein
MSLRNVAPSQPYYSRHPEVQLARGEVKAFLKAYYNAFSALADRETYSFWEHFPGASPHKTHEEGWFLMETRWMLWREVADTLLLFPGIPRAWLESGQELGLHGVASYFGPVEVTVKSELEQGRIRAALDIPTDRGLNAVEIRLPHPQGLRATSADGGEYDPARETVRVDGFTGHAEIVLHF